jgi:transketolase
MLSWEEKQRLEKLAKQLRYDVIEMIGVGAPGHVGGSLSAADIITALYFYKMRYDASDFQWERRDRFVMSKGHSVPIQYAALVHSGILGKEEYKTFKCIGGNLQGHPDHKKKKGIEANTGSLGQGLSTACGLALADRIDGVSRQTYVLLGDAEICEGQIWEAAMAAANFGLDRLTAILDRNGLSATGVFDPRFKLGDIKAKWEAFGWSVIEIDGHDMDQICAALDLAGGQRGKPVIIIANTIKGKGLAFAENQPGFHNSALTQEQYNLALSLLRE